MPDGIRCFFSGYLACARYARLRVAISLALDTPRGAVAHLLDDAKLRSVLKFDAVDDGVVLFAVGLVRLAGFETAFHTRIRCALAGLGRHLHRKSVIQNHGFAVFGEVLPELITLLGASFMHRSAVRGLLKP